MAAPKASDADRVAYFEAAGWRAYYDRAWLRLLRLIVSLFHEQFHIPFPVSWLAAYYVVRASIAWVPLDHDTHKVQRFYTRFYRIARRYSGLQYDPVEAGRLELAYNDIHRQLSGQSDKTAFIETMVALHSTIFGISPDQARESAELRVRANTLVDAISAKRSTDPEADWRKIEKYLSQCYRSIVAAVRTR